MNRILKQMLIIAIIWMAFANNMFAIGLTLLASTNPGDFTASNYPRVKIKMKEMMENEFMYSHLKRPCAIFNCITKKQNVRLNNPIARMSLSDGTVCDGVEVTFLRACDMDVEDCGEGSFEDPCDFGGKEICSEKAFYEPNICFKKGFTVRDSACHDMFDKQEKIAESLASVISALDQEMEKRMISFLIASADDISALDLPTGGLNGNTIWEIDKDEFSAELVIDFMCLLETIGMNNACMVTGKNFYRDYKKKDNRGDSGGCCHFDALLDQFDVCSNIRDVDTLAGGPASFLVAPGAVSYLNQSRFKNTSPENQNDDKNTHTYRVRSNKLKYVVDGREEWVYYDVRWRRCCVESTKHVDGYEWVEKFELRHKGILMNSVTNCDGLRGVIHIQQSCPDC